MEETEVRSGAVRGETGAEGQGSPPTAAPVAGLPRDRREEEVVTKRRSDHRWASAIIAGTTLMLCVFTGGLIFWTSASWRQPDLNLERLIPMTPEGVDLDALIAQVEGQTRDAGGGRFYGMLASLYESRFKMSHSAGDQGLAEEARARARRYQRREKLKENPVPVLLSLLFIFVAAAGGAVWALYNGLAKRDERVDDQWRQIQALLQQRLVLIGGLVGLLKTYMKHTEEQPAIAAVAEARTRALGRLEAAGPQMENTELDHSLQRLLARVEGYPDIKVNPNFLLIQNQLAEAEERMLAERMRYDEAVNLHNEKLSLFPFKLIAPKFNFQPRSTL